MHHATKASIYSFNNQYIDCYRVAHTVTHSFDSQKLNIFFCLFKFLPLVTANKIVIMFGYNFKPVFYI